MAFLPVLTKSNLENFIEQVIQTPDFITIINYDVAEIRMTTPLFPIATSLLNDLTEFCNHSTCCHIGTDGKSRRVWEITGYF